MKPPPGSCVQFPLNPAQAPLIRSQQAGVISRSQLVAAGFPDQFGRDRVRSRRWQRLSDGIYLTHSGEVGWSARCWAALLVGDGHGVIALHAAAYLDGLRPDRPTQIHLLLPHGLRKRRHPSWVKIVSTRRPVSFHGTPRRTGVARTTLDLVQRTAREDDVVGQVTAAARKLGTVVPLRRELEARHYTRHRDLLEGLLAADAEGLESALEYRYDRDVARAHGLPTMQRQVVTTLPTAQIRSDLRSEEYRTRIELDGRVHLATVDADVWRDNAVALAHGELTLRFRWQHVVGAPCDVAEQVAQALRRGGWTGTPRRCGPHCRLP